LAARKVAAGPAGVDALIAKLDNFHKKSPRL